MTRPCPACKNEFELSKSQEHGLKYMIGYQPTCRLEACKKLMREKSRFNTMRLNRYE